LHVVQNLGHFDAYGIRKIATGAFLPIRLDWLSDWFPFFADPATARPPRFWNPNFTDELDRYLGDISFHHPFRFLTFMLIPVGIAFLLLRPPIYVMGFTIVYLGMVTFTIMYHYPGHARHHGILFMAFVGWMWSTRCFDSSASPWRFLWYAILIIGAISGI